MPDAAYYRAWRARNPAYRKREADRRRAARKEGRGDRTKEYRARTLKRAIIRASEEIPPLHTGHELFAQAVEALPSTSSLTKLHDPLIEDLRSEYILALLEGRDPKEAAKKYRTHEYSWGRITAPLLIE